jgi:hypothetical protein
MAFADLRCHEQRQTALDVFLATDLDARWLPVSRPGEPGQIGGLTLLGTGAGLCRVGRRRAVPDTGTE